MADPCSPDSTLSLDAIDSLDKVHAIWYALYDKNHCPLSARCTVLGGVNSTELKRWRKLEHQLDDEMLTLNERARNYLLFFVAPPPTIEVQEQKHEDGAPAASVAASAVAVTTAASTTAAPVDVLAPRVWTQEELVQRCLTLWLSLLPDLPAGCSFLIDCPPFSSSGDIYHVIAFLKFLHQTTLPRALPRVMLCWDLDTPESDKTHVNNKLHADLSLKFAKFLGFDDQQIFTQELPYSAADIRTLDSSRCDNSSHSPCQARICWIRRSPLCS